jgi:hypothetical protein
MVQQNEQLEELAPAGQEGSGSRRKFWRTGLLLTTSAALGGIAVALWNRRSLERIRQQASTQNWPRHPPEEVE